MSGYDIDASIVLYKRKADGVLMTLHIQRSKYPDQEAFSNDLSYYFSDGYYQNSVDALKAF